jgi:hypothetical protein
MRKGFVGGIDLENAAQTTSKSSVRTSKKIIYNDVKKEPVVILSAG